jgi:hypothetical protein
MGDTIYVLGHSQTEIRRLIKQAAIVQTTTEPNPTDEPVAKQSSSRHKGQTEVAGVIFNNQYLPPFRLNSAHNHPLKSYHQALAAGLPIHKVCARMWTGLSLSAC